MRAWWSKFGAFWGGRNSLADDLQDEMNAHLDCVVDEELGKGLTPDEARIAAQRSFGNRTRIAENSWDAWRWVPLDQFRQDLVYGWRTLRRSLGFTITAVGVLALGTGANLTTFEIFLASILQRPAVRDADAIVRIEPIMPFPRFAFYRDHNTVFSYLIAEQAYLGVWMDSDPSPEDAIFVSADYFTDLGINPVQGRLLEGQDELPGAMPVAVLARAFWQRRFGGDPAAVGRVLYLNGKPVQVVGVAPGDFPSLAPQRSTQPALWLPIAARPYLFAGSKALTDFSQKDTAMYAKLRPGITVAAAEAQLAALTTELRTQHPTEIRPRELLRARSLTALPADAARPISVVAAIVFLVLLAACSNLGNMLLARGQARQHEIDIRFALGAGRTRIIRQLIAENILLAGLGGLTGLAVAHFAASVLLSMAGQPSGLRVSTDWHMIIAAGMLALFCAAVFGLAPILMALRRQFRLARIRQVLVAVQITVSVVLLVVATWLARSAQRQVQIDVRFDYPHMLVVEPMLYNHGLEGPAARTMLDGIAGRLAQLPGVRGVTLAISPPLGDEVSSPGLPRMSYNEIAPSYFDFMNLPLVRGRLFSPRETDAVVLSESAARTIWPGEDPLGKIISISRLNRTRHGGTSQGALADLTKNAADQRRVIGVVKDSGATHALNAYMPIDDTRVSSAMVIVHSIGSPTAMLKVVRSAASRPGFAPSVWLMQTNLEQRSGPPPGVLLGVGALGATATLLAALGIFGLVAYAVANRTREIGVRIALGAHPSDIIGTLLSQYAASVTIGAATGLVLARAIALLIASRFVGLEMLDLSSYAVALAIFALVALAAILIPARRAIRIDPASALRWE